MAGIATFPTMAYITVVPAHPSTVVAWALALFLQQRSPFQLLVHLARANCLVALAGMGLNAFLTFGVIPEWVILIQQALAAVFVAGLVFRCRT